MAYYIESGTGKKITDPSQADPSKFYIESSTGKQISGTQLRKTSSSVTDPTDKEFDAYLKSLGLPDDQLKALQAIYGAVSTNDQDLADRMKAGMTAATQFSDPYFKAQTRLAMDALDRSFQAADGDLSYNEKKLRTRLKDLQDDIAASKDMLSFQELQELKDLERKEALDLETTVNDLASRGFTSSSVRSKKEGLIEDAYGDLRESTTRSFRWRKDQLDLQGSRGSRDTLLEVARLRELSSQGKLDTLRKTEETVGSTALKKSGYKNLLGNIGGTIPRQQVLDANSFASQFVF